MTTCRGATGATAGGRGGIWTTAWAGLAPTPWAWWPYPWRPK